VVSRPCTPKSPLQSRQASAVLGTPPSATAAAAGVAESGGDCAGDCSSDRAGAGRVAQPASATSTTLPAKPASRARHRILSAFTGLIRILGYDATMTLSPTRLCWPAFALFLAACGSSGNGGTNDGGSHGGAGGVGGAGGNAGSSGGHTGSGGAGGSGGAASDATTPFVGSWTFDSGSVTPMCSVNVAAISLTGSAVAITKIDSSHIKLAFSNSELTCNVDFAVSGATATAESGQTCTITVMGTSATFKVTTWTLMESGSTISMSVNGTAMVSIVNCTPAGTATLGRAG